VVLTAPAHEVEELLAEIVDDYPEAHFAEVLPALRRYCENAVELRNRWPAVHRMEIGDDIPGYCSALSTIHDLTDEQIGLSDLLRLWPGEHGLPPVRRQ
jgi:hypothetical protein